MSTALEKATEILMMNECITFQTDTVWNLITLPEEQPGRDPWSYIDERPCLWPCKAMSQIYRHIVAGRCLMPMTDVHLDLCALLQPSKVACEQPHPPVRGWTVSRQMKNLLPESQRRALQRPAVG